MNREQRVKSFIDSVSKPKTRGKPRTKKKFLIKFKSDEEKYSRRKQCIKEAIEGLEPRATFCMICEYTREYYCESEFGAHCDLFVDLTDLISCGLIGKKKGEITTKDGGKREVILYFTK